MEKYRQLANEINQIYQASAEAFSNFQMQSGLLCLDSCGRCCLNPEISASSLEMLPLAIHIFDSNLEENTLNNIERNPATCVFYQPTNEDKTNGYCSVYKYRPSVCRSFGAYTRLNKYNQKELAVCKFIKNNTQVDLKKIQLSQAPILGHFASKVAALEFTDGSKFFPINIALKKMLEKLLTYKTYTES